MPEQVLSFLLIGPYLSKPNCIFLHQILEVSWFTIGGGRYTEHVLNLALCIDNHTGCSVQMHCGTSMEFMLLLWKMVVYMVDRWIQVD